jgi:hypothetical protein
MTNVPPAIPMKRRRIAKPVAVSTKPVHAVGIEAEQRTTVKRIRAPYLSQPGPRMKRMKMVPATPTIDEVQISSFVSPRVSRISERRGAMANHMKKAIKNDHLQKREICC